MLLAAVVLGFAGSLHCAGMCSPLAFAALSNSRSAWLHRVLYNFGRILTYCVLGAAVSAAGVLLSVTLQYVISIVLGVALLFLGITGNNFKAPVLAPLRALTSFLKTQFSGFLQDKKHSSIFAMGVLNGLLPCGLTFLALTSCIALQSSIEGFVFMAAFGAGTLPVMLGFVSILPLLTRRLNFSAARLSSIMLIAAGCLLIVRVFLVDPGSHQPVQEAGQAIICP
jgi:sulfite exporter TauE/SafE